MARHPPHADLTELVPLAVLTKPLLGAVEAEAARYRTVPGGAGFVKGLLIEPHTVVRYKLPAAEGKTVRLRAWLLPADGARADVRVTVRSGAAKWEGNVVAGGKAVELAVDRPAGGEAELEVDFGAALRFPCGVVVADPYLVTPKP